MPDTFERHRLTRWVKADVPTYGDEWGDEYDEHPQADCERPASEQIPTDDCPVLLPLETLDTRECNVLESTPKKPDHPVSSSTLVLSIDRSDFTADYLDQDSSEEDDAYECEPQCAGASARLALSVSSEQNSSFLPLQSSGLGRLPLEETLGTSVASKFTYEAPGLLPPTPTYKTHNHFLPESPETDVSDRSFVSDADSIQREPDHLNVRGPYEHAAHRSSFTTDGTTESPDVETIPPVSGRLSEDQSSASMSTGERSFADPLEIHLKHHAPETLVLSIDRMNIGVSDDDSSIGDYNLEIDHQDLTLHGVQSRSSRKSGASAKHEIEDDWGYNSDHSSNLDAQSGNPDLPGVLLRENTIGTTPRPRIKTDALDSLINDLSKLEDDSSLFRGNSSRTLRAGQLDNAKTNLDNQTTEGSKSLLPTLDSIHDMKLPDFENHSFDETTSTNITDDTLGFGTVAPLVPKAVSSSRQVSIRKPPPALSMPEEDVHSVDPQGSITQSEVSANISSSDSLNDPIDESDIPSHVDVHQNNAAPGAQRVPDLVPPPVSKDTSALGRRGSTMSTATFNLGAWKPNTSIYREQFVGDNDNESLMNVSIFNKDDLTYKKFTHMGPISTYAPSISNSSCVSVPDTVDTNLQRINEDQLDDDVPDAISVAKSYQPVTPHESPDQSLGSSILYEHAYEKPKFQEETHTPGGSIDDLAPIREEDEHRVISTGSSGTKDSDKIESETINKSPMKSKYPVSNWKKIMAVSQPIDRIELLKRARIDEMNYETGLSQWLRESLKSTESPHIQIGQLATQAYRNAQHNDIRRHTSIRSKVNLVRDKIEPGHLGMQASSFGRKFLSRGKKLMKQTSD